LGFNSLDEAYAFFILQYYNCLRIWLWLFFKMFFIPKYIKIIYIFYFLKIIFKINASKQSKIYKKINF
jgi:hypothetical protein